MKLPVRLTIPRVPKSPNSLLQRHWRVVQNDKNDWKQRVADLLLEHRNIFGINKFNPAARACKVTIAVHSPYQEMDPDNLQAARKPILDALMHSGILYDDARQWCESTITQHKSTKKEMRTEITVELG